MLQLIIGPMMSGKTTELLRRLTRAQIGGKRVLLVRSEVDTRDYLTHDRAEHQLEEIKLPKIGSSLSVFNNYDVVGIDEGQFFDDLELIDPVADNRTVIVAALSSTYLRKPWPSVLSLIPYAEEITKLNAVCKSCGSEYGAMQYRTVSDTTSMIGGAESYVALCRTCYFEWTS